MLCWVSWACYVLFRDNYTSYLPLMASHEQVENEYGSYGDVSTNPLDRQYLEHLVKLASDSLGNSAVGKFDKVGVSTQPIPITLYQLLLGLCSELGQSDWLR